VAAKISSFPVRVIEAAQQPVVVADHSKSGVVGLVSMAPLQRAETVVVDAGTPEDVRQTLESAIPEVLIAQPDAGS
jgi:DeoR/GlpR family transcriptional regulator of sugar metabolism